MKLLTPLLSLLAPHDCVGCGSEGSLLCRDCEKQLKPAEARCYLCHAGGHGFLTCPSCRSVSALVAVRPAVRYEDAAKDLVWKLKFGRARSAANVMARLMAPLLANVGRRAGGTVVVTSVPTATTRVRQRGYDQAALIGRAVAQRSGLPYARLLGRLGQQKQVGSSRVDRTAQQRHAFRPLRPRQIRGASVVLVDDVVTTGATLQAAAETLTAAGASHVVAVVFAQAHE